MKNKRTISANVLNAMYPNRQKHKACFNKLISRIEQNGLSSLLVHPDFQAEHNKGGKYFVYIEPSDLFYSVAEPIGYIKRCISSDGIKPEEICAITKDGEFYNVG